MNKEFEGKKILILGAITLTCDIVKHAQDMGVYVAVADYYIDSPAKKIADEAVFIDATDVDALVEYCKANKIDGVTTGFTDALMPACYEVCKRLGFPYYVTPKMLSMSTNKVDFKETCIKYGIPVPQTYLIADKIPETIYEKLSYPVFVKPMDASGSRGAGVCYSKNELNKQFEEAVSFSTTKNAIIEEYITGREFLLNYIAVDGEFRLLSMFDRYMCDDRSSARNYANVSMAPSKAVKKYLCNMNDKVISMFKDLGFMDGLIFLQGHTEGDKITFYEMGCRLGGSFYNLEQKCIGCNPVDMIIRYALSGKMVNDINVISPRVADFNQYAFSCNYLLGGSGETVTEIKGLDVMKSLPSYVASIQERGVGTYYEKDSIIDKPLITVYLVNSDLKQAKADILCLNNEIEAFNADGKPLLMHRFDPENL